jgi:hypothetical protein
MVHSSPTRKANLMKRPALAAMTFAAVLACTVAAGATDDTMSGHDAMAHPANMATMLCRPATSGEKSNAMTADKTSLVCKTIDMTKVEKGPAMSPGMTSDEVNKAWIKMLNEYSFINSFGS